MTTPVAGPHPADPVDFRPATTLVGHVVRGVRDEQLDAPTPCGGITVAALLDHIDGLCLAFAAAARKEQLPDGGRARTPDASRLGDDWRDRLPERLDALAAAWEPTEAWTGVTTVGGLDLPAEIAGAAGLDEVLVHGWDLAAATGQPFPAHDGTDDPAINAAYAWAWSIAEQNPAGLPGLFGPPVTVPNDAPPLHRLLGVTGRDPGWAAADR
ncbi:TIGR03086 family metal-binding protein [Streptacidiphilus fuscans]|uniref:TIGR03086 family protein n=1 Tax=Streptacidiphilus fuscans TaxID=2789292 RepID=A0A931B1P3_9ACTN|nr:TIGR03086 family metal-binding protein [Streptacidiphilus fuscans]MBF9068623.1 TIGR03086 family protein [Streptacidiphilus fuscans]